MISCKTCHKQDTAISKEFRARFNNYKCPHHNYRKNMKVKQEPFLAHFTDGVHSGEGDWKVRLIEQSDSQTILERDNHFGSTNLTLSAKWFK